MINFIYVAIQFYHIPQKLQNNSTYQIDGITCEHISISHLSKFGALLRKNYILYYNLMNAHYTCTMHLIN